MRFHWRDTLRRLTGSETRCPVCNTDGLAVVERDERDVLPDLRGIPYCECPKCGVRGEFGELAAMAADRAVEDTVRELRRLGEVEATGRDVDAYCARKAAQAEVDSHLQRCVERLRAAPHLGGIRAGLSVSNLRQLPPDTGLHVPDGAPKQFALLATMRYARTPMTLYRYRFDGETTCVDAQNPKTLQREHRIRITGSVGVYGCDYRFGEVPTVLLATHDPRVAGVVYGAWRAETSLPSPVIGLAGFPLPRKFEAVQTLYLLNTPDHPLPLAFALAALAQPTVYGVDSYPVVKVLSPRCAAGEITAEDLRALSRGSHGTHLRDWLRDTVRTMADRREEVANALLQAEAGEACRAELASLLAGQVPASLLETIRLPLVDPDDVFELGNGRLLKVTPVGLWTARRAQNTQEIVTRTLLCNVGIVVESRIADRGAETAVCTVTHPDADVPSVTVRIPRAHWPNCDAIAEDIRAAYAERGRTPYVAFYRVGGYSWADILQFLGSRCPVQSGIRALGANAEGEIHFPSFVAWTGGTYPQTKAGLIGADVTAAWSALEADHVPSDADALCAFLRTGISLGRTGVAAGVLHALFCAAGRQFDPSGVRRPPAHLLFVETEPGVWDETLRTLAFLFSGSEYVPLMDYSDRPGFLKAWDGLGTLPLVCRLTSCDDLAAVLAGSAVPVIGVADPLTAMGCSGRGTVSFALPHVETSGTPISPDEVSALRRAFVALSVAHAGGSWLDLGLGGAQSCSTPVLTALGTLTDAREEGTVAAGLYRSVRSRYPGVGMTGATAFFAVLRREVLAAKAGDPAGLRVTIVTGAPTDAVKASFNERGEHIFVCADRVLVSRSVVCTLNREQAYLFDAEQLSREFAENGILLDGETPNGIDPRRIWVFPRSVWDAEVVGASGFGHKVKART